MLSVKNVITQITSPALSRITKKSAVRLQKYKNENVFNSCVLKELMTDRFDCKGSIPSRVLVKNRLTGKPAVLKVEVLQEPYILSEHMVQESFVLREIDTEKIVGTKDYILKRLEDGSYRMYQGEMRNCSILYAGVGIRLDQMQIERAIQLGIESIPRTSYPESILYHTKMGFLPRENELEPVKSIFKLDECVKNSFKDSSRYISLDYIDPVILEKQGKFFIDKNRTLADASLRRCKDILACSCNDKILDLSPVSIYLELAGAELQKWKQFIEKHPLLDKLRYNFINDF